MKRRNILTTASLAAMAAAMLTTAQADEAPPTLESETIVVDTVGTAIVADEVQPGREPIVSRPHGRWALGVAIGTLLAGFVSMIGFNGVLGMIANAGRRMGSGVAKASSVSAKVARKTARSARKSLNSPVKILAGSSALAVGLVIAVVAFDIHWKTSLALGTVSAVGGLLGVKKLMKRSEFGPPTAASA